MPTIPRFTQLFLLCCVVVFLPTFLYLRPSASPASPDLYPPAASLSSQGNGVVGGGESTWQWPGEKWLDPARLKAGDYWKNVWGGANGGSSSSSTTGAVPSSAAASVSSTPPAPFASKMANATAKAELGRATWKFLHTMTLRFPDQPTPEQRATLSSFFNSFALLYPCGDCAKHFQHLLRQFPPQTSSRMGAALWLCSMHNMVNDRLGKEEFPCDKLDATYDCGCGDPKVAITSASLLSTLQPAPSPARAAMLKRWADGVGNGDDAQTHRRCLDVCHAQS